MCWMKTEISAETVESSCVSRAKEDMVVVGLHDLQFSASQTVPVDKVFNLPQDDLFPPSADLSLLRLSFPVRLGMTWHIAAASHQTVAQRLLVSRLQCGSGLCPR